MILKLHSPIRGKFFYIWVMAGAKKELPELRIKHVNEKLHSDVNNIADNLGINMSAFVKPFLKELTDRYPAEMKLPKPKIKD